MVSREPDSFNGKLNLRQGAVANERRSARRVEIERAAVKCLSKQPYSTTTVQAIANAAGIGVGLMYRDVASKEEILMLIFDHVLSRYETEFGDAHKGDQPAPVKLHTAMKRYFDIVASDPERTLITYRESAQLSDAAKEEVKRREHETNRPLELIVEQGIQEGTMRPVNAGVMAYTIAVLAHAWALKGWYLRDVMTLDEYFKTQYAMIVDHLTPIPGSS